MKTPNNLEVLPPMQNRPTPLLLRAAIASVLLATLPAQASGPEYKEYPTVAVLNAQKGSKMQPKTDPFEEGLKGIRQASSEAEVRKLWLRLAMAQPAKILEYSELIDSAFRMETLRMACGVAATQFPEVFLQKAFDCTDLPDYPELVLKAAKNASETKPEAALEFKDRYSTFPGGQKILERAMENVRKKTIRVTQKTSPFNWQSKQLSK